MPHYKRMFDDKEHLYAFDLDGREVTVTIEKVFAGELQGDKGRKSKKPILKFVGKEKKLACNKTNGKAIATMYGTNTDDWAGKQITIYPTTTEFGGETVECIRVKPVRPEGRPSGGKSGKSKQAQPDVAAQIAEEMSKSEAKADLYRHLGETHELDVNEYRWLSESGYPRDAADTSSPNEDECAVINDSALKEGVRRGG